jgi:flagellar basal body-associated protein FliL
MNRHDITLQQAILLAGAYFLIPALIVGIICAIYSQRATPRNEQVVYQLAEFGGNTGMNTGSATADMIYEMPPLSLTINSGTSYHGIMKIRLNIAVDRNDVPTIKSNQPRINERIVLFLHQKSYDDMQDPRKMKALLADLTKEIDQAVAPVTIDGIFVKQFVLE